MGKQQSFEIKSQEPTEDKKQWHLFKEYTCGPILTFLFCYRTLIYYYGKIFLLLANCTVVFGFLILF